MIYGYALTDDGRIAATVVPAQEGMDTFDFADDFDFEHQADYKIVDGALMHDPLPAVEPDPVEAPVTLADVVEALDALAAIVLGEG